MVYSALKNLLLSERKNSVLKMDELETPEPRIMSKKVKQRSSKKQFLCYHIFPKLYRRSQVAPQWAGPGWMPDTHSYPSPPPVGRGEKIH